MNNHRSNYRIFRKKLGFTLALLTIYLPIFSPNLVFAESETNSLLTEIKKQLKKLKNEQAVLEKRLEEIEDKEKTRQLMTQTTSQPIANGSDNQLKIGLSGLFAGGFSSVDNNDLENLQAGGHDPNRNGFTVQNVELSINSTVDPYFDAQANIIFLIDQDGETVVELEEAFFTTRALSSGLQVKAGQYFTEFGRLNPMHPHRWDFVDQPVILSRLFGGDGLRSQGARVSWLMPTDWYSELIIGAQNAKGETVASFLFEEDEVIAGHLLGERSARNFSDLLFSARWLNSVDFSDSTSFNFGLSGLSGPNSSGKTTNTSIVGADAFLKWHPDYSQRGFPFVSWHTEWLSRRYEANDRGNFNREVLTDSGFFSQLLWGFELDWIAGLRFENTHANGDNLLDPLRDKRRRLSANLTWRLSEFSKLRLQYNRDWAEHLEEDTADSLILQMEFSLGSHMAHKF